MLQIPRRNKEGAGAEPLSVSIASASTKQAWMEAAAKRFMATGARTRDGRPIQVKVVSVSSGVSLKDLHGAVCQTSRVLQQRQRAMSLGGAARSAAHVGLAAWQSAAYSIRAFG